MTIEERAALIHIAAAMLRAEKFLSPYAEDNPRTTPKSILTRAAEQREQLRLWAIELSDLARSSKLPEVK